MTADLDRARAEPTPTAYSKVAGRIAAEVHYAHQLGQTRLTKVTSLLRCFRTSDSPPRIREVLAALAEHGLSVDSGWRADGGLPVIRRAGCLTLSPARPPVAGCETVRPPSVAPGDPRVRLSVWRPGQAPGAEEPAVAEVAPSSSDILWFDIDAPALAPAPAPGQKTRSETPPGALARSSDPDYYVIESRVSELTPQLTPWCPGLDEEMVRDLLRRDHQPKVEDYGDAHDGVRGVSAVAVLAREIPCDDLDGVDEQLVFQMVEIIVGPGWLVTCWHPSRVFVGPDDVRGADPILRESFLSRVRQQWVDPTSSAPQTSGDLGLYLAESLLDSYSGSHRMMERWVAHWEVEFYRSLGSGNNATRLQWAARQISSLLSMTGEFRRSLTAFEQGRWATYDHTWFPAVSVSAPDQPGAAIHVEALATVLETTGRNLNLLSESIRADINLLMLQNAATQQEAAERTQGYLTKVTGLVLVPTLIAGLFGANTSLPGGGDWLGFEIMLVLMLVSGLAVYLSLRRLSR